MTAALQRINLATESIQVLPVQVAAPIPVLPRVGEPATAELRLLAEEGVAGVGATQVSVDLPAAQPVRAGATGAMAPTVASFTVPAVLLQAPGRIAIRISVTPVPSIVVLKLIILDLGVVAGCDHDDEHEEDEDNHDIHAALICDVDFTRGAPPVDTPAGLALGGCLAHIEVSLHALSADTVTSRAVAE